MKQLGKQLLYVGVVIGFIALSAAAAFQLSKSRTFQFFGELVYSVDTQEKVVALTFDDAPTEYTPEVLQVLADKKVKGTFFVIGQEMEKNPQVGKDIVKAGHEMGNHSYSHERFLLKSQSFIDSEIQKTNKLIRDAGYTKEITFRPPNGKKLLGLPWYLYKHDITTIMWDVEPDTYITNQTGKAKTDFIVNYAVSHTKPGSIILLHPFCKECGSDREAVSHIIDKLRAQGYTFVTVSELRGYASQ